MQMDAEVMSTEGHDALHAVEAARAIDADVLRLEKRIAEVKAYLSELRTTREQKLADLRRVVRGEPLEQPELPFASGVDADEEAGEIAGPRLVGSDRKAGKLLANLMDRVGYPALLNLVCGSLGIAQPVEEDELRLPLGVLQTIEQAVKTLEEEE